MLVLLAVFVVEGGVKHRQPDLFDLPFSQCITRTAYALPEEVSPDEWVEIGKGLGRARGSLMWWIGDWWAFGERRYGERAAIVGADEWDGPALQTCKNAATVCRAFVASRRRDALGFNAHAEVAALPLEWQDEILDWAEEDENGKPRTIREIRDRVKQVRAHLAQGWTPDQLDRKAACETGKCVVANIREGEDGRRRDEALLAWAEASDRFVCIDRSTKWGNPFEIPDDGTRADVVAKFSKFYLPHKGGLLSRMPSLRGKVLGCWCHPEECHGHIIAEIVNREAAGEGSPEMLADQLAEVDG